MRSLEPWARGAWSPGIRPVLGWGGGVRPGWKREQKWGRGAQREVGGGARIETWVAEMVQMLRVSGVCWGVTGVIGISAIMLGFSRIMRCQGSQGGGQVGAEQCGVHEE